MSGPPPAGPPPEDDFNDSGDDAVVHGFANQVASGQIGGLDEAVAASEDGFGETESKVDDELFSLIRNERLCSAKLQSADHILNRRPRSFDVAPVLAKILREV